MAVNGGLLFTPSGSRLLTGDFARTAIRNAPVDARRRLTGMAVKAVLSDNALNKALEKRFSGKKA